LTELVMIREKLPEATKSARDKKGRFRAGNPGGPGNPLARKVGKLRAVLLASVSVKDIRLVARVLVKEARRGNMQAVRELLDRLFGRPVEADLIERLERMEAAVQARRHK
jgi:hypothetical protein